MNEQEGYSEILGTRVKLTGCLDSNCKFFLIEFVQHHLFRSVATLGILNQLEGMVAPVALIVTELNWVWV